MRRSQRKIDVFALAQVARMAIHRIGSDFDAFISQLEKEACEKDAKVFLELNDFMILKPVQGYKR